MENNWARVIDVVSSANRHVLLAAPRIKFPVFEKIMNLIPDSVQNVDCITSWMPNNPNRQACDLKVFDLLANRKEARLWNCEQLHAKYIRSDDRCLIGSSNLTFQGFGLNPPRNFELQIEVPSHYPGLKEWETALFSRSHLVTARPSDEQIEESSLRSMQRSTQPWTWIKIPPTAIQNLYWIPLCPCPEKLFGVHAGSIGKREMASSAYELAQRDLSALDPPAGCANEKDFTSFIASRLMGLQFFIYIFSLSRSGISDYQAMEIVALFLENTHGIRPEEAWETIKLWLMQFFAEEFKIESRQEILIREPTPSS